MSNRDTLAFAKSSLGGRKAKNLNSSKNNKPFNVDEAVSSVADVISNALFPVLPKKVKDGSFNNPAMLTGASNYMLNNAYYSNDLLTMKQEELLALYNGCWVFRKMVDIPARAMWSNGIDINIESDEVIDLSRVYAVFNKLKSKLIYATTQARIFGGAIAVIMVDDGEDDLSNPLKVGNIEKGAKITLMPFDRWYGVSPSTELVDDMASDEFGLPKSYSIQVGAGSQKSTQNVHHSRVLRFINRCSPRQTQDQLQGWGISEIEHVYQDLMNHENTKNSIASLLNKALIEFFKIDGLRSTFDGLINGSPQAQARLTAQMQAMNGYRTSNRMVLMDKEDEYEKQEYSFGGLAEILNSQKDIVAGAAEMPEVYLFGTNRAGLNGDKPIELKIYEDTIRGKQENECRPVLDKLLPVIFATCGIKVNMQNMTYDFISMLDDSDDVKQSYLSNLVSNISTLLDNGLITHETALKEIKSAVKKTKFGLEITDTDFELARRTDKQESTSEGEDENGLDLGLDTDTDNIDEEDKGSKFETQELKKDDYTVAKNKILSKIKEK